MKVSEFQNLSFRDKAHTLNQLHMLYDVCAKNMGLDCNEYLFCEAYQLDDGYALWLRTPEDDLFYAVCSGEEARELGESLVKEKLREYGHLRPV